MKSYFPRLLLLLTVLFWGMMLSACNEAAPPEGHAAPATRSVPPAFQNVWKACGGSEGAGEWVYGPAWFKGSLLGIAQHMVFVWSSHAPQSGPQPFQTLIPPDNAAYPIPAPFQQWISHHGGERCSGPPVSPAGPMDGATCQNFTNLTLCMDAEGEKVWATNRGEEFYHVRGNNLLLRLPTAMQPQPGWKAQVNLTISEDLRRAQIIARVSYHDTANFPQHTVIASQLNDSQMGAIFFDLTQAPADGIWKHEVPLVQLTPGNHTLVIQTCVVTDDWQACDEDVAQLKIPGP